MGKYFLLQLKRFFRVLPFAFAVILLLFCGLMIVMNGIVGMLSDTDSETKVQIAVVGEAEDSFLQMGLTALRSLDSSRFAVEVLSMEEEAAIKALEQGQIGAYVVIPEGFVEEALQGRVKTLKFVSTVGATGLVSMFKAEITKVISDMVLACQRGMFGIENVLAQAGQTDGYGSYMNALSVSYVEFILSRSKAYRVEELSAFNELSFEENLLCGICVLFLTLAVLPFSFLLIRQDVSVDRILLAKRHSIAGQVLCEYTAFFLCFLLQMLLTYFFAAMAAKFLRLDMPFLTDEINILTTLEMLCVILMITAFGYMLFGLSSSLVGGVFLQFFVGLFICFVSGCMYPISFFSEAMRKFSANLPHSIARDCVGDWVMGLPSGGCAVLILVSLLFLAVSVLLRKRRIASLGG